MRCLCLGVVLLLNVLTALAQSGSPEDNSDETPRAKITKSMPNIVPDLLLPPETRWNAFSPELIPDFEIPKKYDRILKTKVPAKSFIWQQPGRNMFRTVTEGTDAEKYKSELQAMLRKGITAVNETYMRPGYERLDPDIHVFENSKPYYSVRTQVVGGMGCGNDTEIRKNWDTWVNWWHHNVDEAARVFQAPRTKDKADIFFVYPDLEATDTAGASQDATNHLVVGNYAMLEKTNGYVAQMYLGPVSTLGYINEEAYGDPGKTMAWFSPADDNAPERFRGKKNIGNPAIIASFEVSPHYEAWIPEGTQVRDQNNKPWFVCTHFGEATGQKMGPTTQPNTEHWAARVGGLTETSLQYTRPVGQKLIVMLKADCDSGFQYAAEKAIEGRWIKEYNRYGITHPGPNNTEFLGALGSEAMPTFVAEAQTALAVFSGVDAILLWDSAYQPEFRPHLRDKDHPRRGAKHNDPEWMNMDYEQYNYPLKTLWRLAQPVTLENGQKLSFFDICDGNEEYLNWNTRVSYDNGKTFDQPRALDWQYQKLTAVRAVVNPSKKVIFILAFQPYGVEQNSVIVRYEAPGCKFTKKINVPAGQVVMQAYQLKGLITSKQSATSAKTEDADEEVDQ